MFIFRYFSKDFILTGLGTFTSRITGLFRDIAMSVIFGTSGVLSVFLTVFSFVNILRKIFGEGITNAIIVPQTVQKLKENKAQSYSSTIIANIASIIFVIIILASLASSTIIILAPQQSLFGKVTLILLPYSFFICMSVILGGLLNIKKCFFLPSVSSITTNLAMIIFCLFFSHLTENLENKILILSFFVTIASVIQSFILLLKLKTYQWVICTKPNFKSQDWQNFKKLFIPVLISFGLLNISTYIDRGLAWIVSENTVSILYFAERITYLSVGLFAVSLATSVHPLISKNFSKKKYLDAQKNLTKACKQILLLVIPSTLFLLFFKKDIITSLFFHGNFNQESVNLTVEVLNFYAIGIPAFSLIKIMHIAFYSQSNTKFPLHAGVIGTIVNIITSISFISLLQGGSIALGTSLAAYATLIYLIIKLPNLSRKTITYQLISNSFLILTTSLAICYTMKKIVIIPQGSISQILTLSIIGTTIIGFNFLCIKKIEHFLAKVIFKK